MQEFLKQNESNTVFGFHRIKKSSSNYLNWKWLFWWILAHFADAIAMLYFYFVTKSLSLDFRERDNNWILTRLSPLCNRLVRGSSRSKCGLRSAGLRCQGCKRSSSRFTARTSGCGGGRQLTRHVHVASRNTSDFIVKHWKDFDNATFKV